MKEKYIRPQSDAQEFDTYDIITTSNPADDNDVIWGT